MSEEVEVAEATKDEVEVPVEVKETPATPEQLETEEKEFKNPHARARYLERENRNLEDRLNTVMSALQAAAQAKRDGEEIERPDNIDVSEEEWEADPLAVLRRETRETKAMLAEMAQRISYNAATTQLESTIGKANTMIINRINEDPETYKDAFVYLINVLHEEIAEESPGLTERESNAEVAVRLDQIKIAAVQHGRNPADDFMRKSKRFGWKAAAKKAENEDASETIRTAKRREEGTRSLSDSPGGGPKVKIDFSKMSKEDFNRTLDEGIKSGRYKREGGAYRTPPLRDLIPHKMIKVG